MKIMVRWNGMKIKGDISVHSLLRKLRTGFQMLSHLRWVSAYGPQLSVASVLGVAGLILAVRDGRMGKLFSERSASSGKQCFVPGLRNLGNNCFLNVVLQSLAGCLSFRHFLEEVESVQLSSHGEQVEDLPLLLSLTSLLEELSIIQERSKTLNPRNVMTAMQEYIPQFHLTNQQDSAEALLHLLSCLRDELSASYMPSCGSLADVAAPTSRILSLKGMNHINDPGRWRQQYLGPFDGILGSFLSCRSCSSEIMMDFGFFHTLPLSLMVNSSAPLLDRFTIEDCIKRFLGPEHVENYSCSHCWHISAIKFLSSIRAHEEEIKKLSCCSEQDSCDCRNMSSLQALPWSDCTSRAFKQLSIAYCPQILCLHLQRTTMNVFGEPVKIQGHIAFPLILNLAPFVKHETGNQKQEADKQTNLTDQQNPRTISSSGEVVKDDTSQTSKPSTLLDESCSSTNFVDTPNKGTFSPVPSKSYLYRLVSVVEHFGRAGTVHYTVYRGVRTRIEENDNVEGIHHSSMQWFHISDTAVCNATEEDVLDSEASLLFYERI